MGLEKSILKKIGSCLFFIAAFGSNTTVVQAQSIFINEFMASNQSTIDDEQGGFDDWVELYNAESIPIDVGGMYLTDNLSDLNKWQIPTSDASVTTIPPNGYLVFWFDDNPDEGLLHTKMKLSSNGEEIGLVSSDGNTIIDSITYGIQLPDISSGRNMDGGNSFTYFLNPSPDAANDAVGSSLIEAPIPSITRGHYATPLFIDLSSPTPNAEIYYTLNGDTPNENSLLYSAPILIDNTTVLRSVALRDNDIPSRVETHTYLFNVEHTFPIVCISTDDANFFGEEAGIYENFNDDIEHPAHVELFEADGSFGFNQNLGISLHGSWSVNHPQKGLGLVARSKYGSSAIEYPLFPNLPYDEYGSFILRASGNDFKNAMFRDAMASSLLRDNEDVKSLIEQPDLDLQDYRPTAVYLNGNYFGIHNLREKMDHRYFKTHYDIDKEDLDLIQGFKSVETGDDLAFDDYFYYVEDHDFNVPENLDSLQKWLSIDHYLDYILFHVYIDNTDWPDTNNKHWRERKANRQWRYLIYDLDKGFGLNPLNGTYSTGDWNSESLFMVLDENHDYDHNAPWSTLILRRLLENEDIRKRFITRMADKLNIMYHTDRVVNRVNEFEAAYLPEWEKHDAVWNHQNEDKWLANVDDTRRFALSRDSFLWQHFAAYFSNDVDEVVNLSLQTNPTNAGTFHLNTMTLPSDINWSGQYFAGIDVPLSVIPGPGYTFESWEGNVSGIMDRETTMNLANDQTISANFVQGSTMFGNLVINEINYNSPESLDAGDWIELYNNSSESVDLSGWYFEDETEYFNLPTNLTIPANGYLVLVEDSLKFKSIYPGIENYLGNFGQSIFGSFKLNNGGEQIQINNANASFIDQVNYDDQLPWPEAADGTGPTLQLLSPDLDNALPESWMALIATPGEVNDIALSINQENDFVQKIILFPNPAFNKINLDISRVEEKVLRLKVYNSLGQLISERSTTEINEQMEFNLRNYGSGIYWIELEMENGRKVNKKFVVAKQ